MKGPGLRNQLEVRRRWKCPQCGKEVLKPGDETAARCSCQKEEKLMKLIEEFVPPKAQRFKYVPPKPEEEEPAQETAPPPAEDK